MASQPLWLALAVLVLASCILTGQALTLVGLRGNCSCTSSSTSLSCSSAGLQTLPPALAECGLLQTITLGDTFGLNQLNFITAVPTGFFTGLTAVTSINMPYNLLTTLPATVFSGLSTVTTLLFSFNSITSLPTNIFNSLTSLQILRLDNNLLTSLPSNFLPSPGVLTVLTLNNNKLTSLATNALNGLTRLPTIDLSDNLLTSVPAGLFQGLTAALTIDLSNNMMSTLPATVFNNLTALDALYVTDNSLTSFPEIKNSSAIRSLYVSSNKLTSVDFVAGLTALQFLHLEDNLVPNITAGTFYNLTALVQLYMSDNLLTSLPSDVFARASKVSHIYMQNNLLTSLPSNFGAALTSLFDLRLHDNRLSALPTGIFSVTSQLQSIYLAFNRLTSLPTNLLFNTTKLQRIELDNNALTAIPSALFANATGLFFIYLNYNSLTSLPNNTFGTQTRTTNILLHNNQLTEVPEALRDLTAVPALQLQVLTLNDNNISRVPTLLSTFWTRQNRTLVTFTNNPSICEYVYDLALRGRRLLCDCAVAYYSSGLGDNCESLSNFVRLPTHVSFFGQRYLESQFLFSGRQLLQGVTNVQSEQPVNLNLQLNFTAPNTPTSTVFLAVTSAFKTTSLFNPLPPSTDSSTTSLYATVSLQFAATANPTIPTEFSYYMAAHTNSSALANASAFSIPGLTFTGSSGLLAGQPSSAGNFTFDLWALDSFTNESKLFLFYTLTVLDCGSATCLNNGTCIDDNAGTSNNLFTCECAEGFGGSRCASLLLRTTTATSSSSNLLTAVVPAALGFAALAALLILLVVFRARRAMAANRKDYHIFISYRVETDKDIAHTLCKTLQHCTVPLSSKEVIPIKVFLDAKDIVDGTNWKMAFVTALKHACLFVPIVSEAGLEPLKSQPQVKGKPDNVLLEYEIALKQQKAKRLAILPVFVGHRLANDTAAARFSFENSGGHMFPDTSSLTDPSSSIRTTISGIMANQGLFFARLTAEDLLYFPKPGEASASVSSSDFSITDRTVKALLDSAWDNPSNPSAVAGRKHWSFPKAQNRATLDLIPLSSRTTTVDIMAVNDLVVEDGSLVDSS